MGYMTKDFVKSLIKFKKFIKELPDQTTKALKTVQEGRIKVDIEDTDINRLSLELDRSSNRIAYGMVIAALIVAGSLVVNVSMPRIFNLSIISFLCFLFAVLLGLLLLKSIQTEKKLKVK